LATYRIYLQTQAESRVDVEIDSSQYEDETELAEAVENEAWQELPDICAHCSGWGRKVGLSINQDGWEPIPLHQEVLVHLVLN